MRNVTTFEQDRDSTVGGGGNQYTVGYTWAKATPSGGHDTLRCTGMTLPGSGDSATITYTYDSASNVLDDACSRVSKLQTGSGGGGPTTRATYKYLGASHLVGTDLVEPDVYTRLYGSGTANYDAVDRFNRTTTSRWTKNISPVRNFYDVTLAYDRDSNITSTDDAVRPGFDVAYTMDSRNRLTRADEGTLSTGSITSRTRDQQWTLSQPGNWARNKLDLDGDGNFTGGGELDDTGTFNTVNELTARDIDTSGGNDYTLTYDAVGNLTDDGEDFKYVYDAFGRLVTVKNQSNAVVASYTYNGLGYRLSWHYDTDTDADVDGSDKYYRFAYDVKWRVVATFRDSESNPKERFVWQNAGLNGRGGSSYIDTAVLRDRDMTNGWTGSADGTLEQRHYYCQNWRADVSVVLKYEDSVWRVAEWIKYSAYGVPFAITPADYDGSGFVDIDDDTDFDAAYNGGAGSWSARVDLDLDGSLTSNDEDIFDAEFVGGESGGRFVLSRGSVANRLGYAGYQYDACLVGAERSFYHIRYRTYHANTGMWLVRDPMNEIDGPGLYLHTQDSPVTFRDYLGLAQDIVWEPGTQRLGFSGKTVRHTMQWLPKLVNWGCGDDDVYAVQIIHHAVWASRCDGTILKDAIDPPLFLYMETWRFGAFSKLSFPFSPGDGGKLPSPNADQYYYEYDWRAISSSSTQIGYIKAFCRSELMDVPSPPWTWPTSGPNEPPAGLRWKRLTDWADVPDWFYSNNLGDYRFGTTGCNDCGPYQATGYVVPNRPGNDVITKQTPR